MADIIAPSGARRYAYGREVLETRDLADPWDGGYVLSPLILSSDCRLSFWFDGSGAIKGPSGKILAEWDVQTREVDVFAGDGRRVSMTNPYEPGGCDILADEAALLNAVELDVAKRHPDLVRVELRSA